MQSFCQKIGHIAQKCRDRNQGKPRTPTYQRYPDRGRGRGASTAGHGSRGSRGSQSHTGRGHRTNFLMQTRTDHSSEEPHIELSHVELDNGAEAVHDDGVEYNMFTLGTM